MLGLPYNEQGSNNGERPDDRLWAGRSSPARAIESESAATHDLLLELGGHPLLTPAGCDRADCCGAGVQTLISEARAFTEDGATKAPSAVMAGAEFSCDFVDGDESVELHVALFPRVVQML